MREERSSWNTTTPKIDLKAWSRGDLFRSCIDNMRIVMSLTVDVDVTNLLAPVITWGKHQREGDKLLMPLTMNIHHAVADGYHLSRFFTEAQELMDSLW